MMRAIVIEKFGGPDCLVYKDLPEPEPLASGVYLTFFGSFAFGTPGFPLSDVPLQTIAEQAAAGRLTTKPSRVFQFDQIREAHRVTDAGKGGGKVVGIQ